MGIVVLGTSFMAALAIAISAYTATGSIVWGVVAYAISGTLVLFAALLAALLKDHAELSEMSDPLLFPAE